MKLPKKLIVKIDTREQKELPFDKLHNIKLDFHGKQHIIPISTVSEELSAGDYTLEGLEDIWAVETKRSVAELWANLTTRDSSRFVRAFDRLLVLPYPVLVLEIGVTDVFKEQPHLPGYSPERMMGSLTELMARSGQGLQLLFTGPSQTVDHRRKVCEFLLQLGLAQLQQVL